MAAAAAKRLTAVVFAAEEAPRNPIRSAAKPPIQMPAAATCADCAITLIADGHELAAAWPLATCTTIAATVANPAAVRAARRTRDPRLWRSPTRSAAPATPIATA